LEAASAVRSALDAGIAPERIAVIYPSRGVLPDRIIHELSCLGIPFQFEQDDLLPAAPMSTLIQGCASRAVVNSRVRGLPEEGVAALLGRTTSPTLRDLYGSLLRLRKDASLPAPCSRLQVLRALQLALDPSTPLDTTADASGWVESLASDLELFTICSAQPALEGGNVLQDVLEICRDRRPSLEDLAASLEIIGKVVLTTYHSSKGREFHTVVLPGLVDGYFPMSVYSKGAWRPPRGAQLDAVRRQFYVGLSRAEQTAVLITGEAYENRGGSWRAPGRSQLVIDVQTAVST
jgi:DNA helicase-2/ATP-dependent DNA helicase PcrA